MSMWEPFSEQARRAMVAAQEVAQRLNTPYIDSEHILLGAVEAGESPLVEALAAFDISVQRFREGAERTIKGGGEGAPPREMVFTPRAKRLIELAFEEARKLQHRYIGSEHLMLGYLSESHGKSDLLQDLNVDASALRAKLVELVPPAQASPEQTARRTLDECYGYVTARRITHVETDVFWESLARAVEKKDVAAALLFGFLIARRSGWRVHDTAAHVEETFRRTFEA